MLRFVIEFSLFIARDVKKADRTCPSLSACIGLKCPILTNCEIVNIVICQCNPNGPAIAGIVIGTVAGIAILCMGCCYLLPMLLL